MKKVFIVIILFILLGILGVMAVPVAKIENERPTDKEIVVSKALSSWEITLLSRSFSRIVFNEIDKDTVDYQMKRVEFLGSKELLGQKITNFYGIYTKKIGDDGMKVFVMYYGSDTLYEFEYKKINGEWKEQNKQWGRVKMKLTRPHYIYLEAERLKDESFYKKVYIPRDSVK